MARGAAQVTVVQGTGLSTSSERLLIADRFYGGQRTARVHVDPVIRNLQRIYGTPDGGLSQIEPDLIGQHHVATVGDVDMLEGCLEWIESGPADTRQRHRRHLLTVLQRATHREHGAKAEQASALLGHLSQKHLTSLAREMVAVIIETPGTMAALLEGRIDALDEATLAAIGEVLPVQLLALMEVSTRRVAPCDRGTHTSRRSMVDTASLAFSSGPSSACRPAEHARRSPRQPRSVG